MEKAGAFIGTVHSVLGNDIIVKGKDIAAKVRIMDSLCGFSGEKLVIFRAVFPMMTTAKCRVVSGSPKDVKAGMKVYRYTGAKDNQQGAGHRTPAS